MSSVIPDKLKEELEDVRMVYYKKGMVVYPNSFSKLETEIIKVCNTKNNLEKENAELQEQNRKLLESCEGATMMYEDLTKAKKLLKDITSSYGSTEVSEAQFYLKIKKAEQFLKEVEK